MNKKTRELTLAALLTALSLLITYSPVKLNLIFFTLTPGAHVPTMLAMFSSPWVVIMTVIGSCIGFLTALPAPSSILVAIRAATHLVFALWGIRKIKDGRMNMFLIILITALMHALTEGLAVFFLTPVIINVDTAALTAAAIAFFGTFVHHFIDCAITAPILAALSKAKILHLPQNFQFKKKQKNVSAL